MSKRQIPLPCLWLISDARNDAALDEALRQLPRGAGLIFRHYHLGGPARRARFAKLARIARRRGQLAALAGPMPLARSWRSDGAYGSPRLLASGPAGLRLVTAHSLREIGAARRARADAILLSPVFPTRSHPGGSVLGRVRFALLARRAGLPVIALGGMTAARAKAMRHLGARGWAAIDGLSHAHPARK